MTVPLAMKRGTRPRVLFLAPRYPLPPTRGDQRRVLHLVEGLAKHADVVLASFGDGPRLGLDAVRAEQPKRGLPATLLENLRTPRPSLPLQVRMFLDSGMRSVVQRELAGWRPDVVHATLARTAPYVPPSGPYHRHLDYVDALSLNMETRAQGSALPARLLFGFEARLMRRYEAQTAAAFDSSSVVAEADRLAAPGLAEATVIPNGVDLASFPFEDPSGRPTRMLFFGNLGYFHNVAPARFVAEKVLPVVRRSVPEVELAIAGARPHSTVSRLDRLDGVSLHVDVPSMATELHGAAVAVLPMFSGSGMKNKVLEAFCSGTPVVSNAAGIEGIAGVEGGHHYLAGETVTELADACRRLLTDPAARSELAEAGLALVRERYTWERQVEVLLGLYKLQER